MNGGPAIIWMGRAAGIRITGLLLTGSDLCKLLTDCE